ncbi:unnamed protein product [Closterium sp. NIES-65]|nr:unnamed protein product [Closterium sp. NIES-65]
MGGDSEWGVMGGDSEWEVMGGDSEWGVMGGDSEWGVMGDDSEWGVMGGDSEWGMAGGDNTVPLNRMSHTGMALIDFGKNAPALDGGWEATSTCLPLYFKGHTGKALLLFEENAKGWEAASKLDKTYSQAGLGRKGFSNGRRGETKELFAWAAREQDLKEESEKGPLGSVLHKKHKATKSLREVLDEEESVKRQQEREERRVQERAYMRLSERLQDTEGRLKEMEDSAMQLRKKHEQELAEAHAHTQEVVERQMRNRMREVRRMEGEVEWLQQQLEAKSADEKKTRRRLEELTWKLKQQEKQGELQQQQAQRRAREMEELEGMFQQVRLKVEQKHRMEIQVEEAKGKQAVAGVGEGEGEGELEGEGSKEAEERLRRLEEELEEAKEMVEEEQDRFFRLSVVARVKDDDVLNARKTALEFLKDNQKLLKAVTLPGVPELVNNPPVRPQTVGLLKKPLWLKAYTACRTCKACPACRANKALKKCERCRTCGVCKEGMEGREERDPNWQADFTVKFSAWEELIRSTDYDFFRVQEINGVAKRVFNSTDELVAKAMREIEADFAWAGVADFKRAAAEIEEYNASGRYPVLLLVSTEGDEAEEGNGGGEGSCGGEGTAGGEQAGAALAGGGAAGGGGGGGGKGAGGGEEVGGVRKVAKIGTVVSYLVDILKVLIAAAPKAEAVEGRKKRRAEESVEGASVGGRAGGGARGGRGGGGGAEGGAGGRGGAGAGGGVGGRVGDNCASMGGRNQSSTVEWRGVENGYGGGRGEGITAGNGGNRALAASTVRLVNDIVAPVRVPGMNRTNKVGVEQEVLGTKVDLTERGENEKSPDAGREERGRKRKEQPKPPSTGDAGESERRRRESGLENGGREERGHTGDGGAGELERLRRRLKEWERRLAASHGRAPSRADVEADQAVAEQRLFNALFSPPSPPIRVAAEQRLFNALFSPPSPPIRVAAEQRLFNALFSPPSPPIRVAAEQYVAYARLKERERRKRKRPQEGAGGLVGGGRIGSEEKRDDGAENERDGASGRVGRVVGSRGKKVGGSEGREVGQRRRQVVKVKGRKRVRAEESDGEEDAEAGERREEQGNDGKGGAGERVGGRRVTRLAVRKAKEDGLEGEEKGDGGREGENGSKRGKGSESGSDGSEEESESESGSESGSDSGSDWGKERGGSSSSESEEEEMGGEEVEGEKQERSEADTTDRVAFDRVTAGTVTREGESGTEAERRKKQRRMAAASGAGTTGGGRGRIGYGLTSSRGVKGRPGLQGRDNFVRLNINGRGGKKRFGNGTKTSRFGSRNGGGSRFGRFRGGYGGGRRKGGYRKNGKGGGAGEGGECGMGLGGWMDDGAMMGLEGAGEKGERGEAREGGAALKVRQMENERTVGRVGGVARNDRAGRDPSEGNLLRVLRNVFGFDRFRDGQVAAIQRVLRGQSTLLVLPTGAGKSLCYQLPAFLLLGPASGVNARPAGTPAAVPCLVLPLTPTQIPHKPRNPTPLPRSSQPSSSLVCPLVALMQDQLAHLPPCLPGALLSSFQSPSESGAVIERLREGELKSPGESGAVIERLRGGELKVLFVSPERLAAPSFLLLLSSLPQGVSLVVFDEAHCISEWSHNFRSAYLRLSSILLSSGLLERQAAAPEERKAAAAAAEEASDTKASSADPSFADGGGGAAAVAAAASDVEGTNDCLPGGDNTNSSNIPRRPCILAITATATRLATSSLIAALGIPPGGVIRRGVVRPNLHLSVSITGAKGLVPGTGSGPADVVGENKWGGGAAAAGHSRQRALVDLLAAPPFSSARSIIVYCSFQVGAPSQWEADDLARILRDNRIAARSYHGGLQAGERTRILQRFTANKLRVAVATLAFGMGLDKADVGAVSGVAYGWDGAMCMGLCMWAKLSLHWCGVWHGLGQGSY